MNSNRGLSFSMPGFPIGAKKSGVETPVGGGVRFRVAVLLLSVLAPAGAASAAGSPVAFPGAYGFGAGATGWRFGRIEYVTSLRDKGPGSLRDCVERSARPRVCLIMVGGTIKLKSSIYVRSNVYIAGQTAPAEGVQLRLEGGQGATLVIKNAHEVVVRFLKLRPGPSARPDESGSAILVENSHDVIIDHCSLAFATDQNFSVHFEGGDSYDITLQRSIVAWGLDQANHPKGRHSKGALICSGLAGSGNCGRISLFENLFAHNRDRNPEISGTGLGPFQVVSNLFYDPISQFGEFYNRYGPVEVDYVGNVVLSGPSTRRLQPPPAVETYNSYEHPAVSVFAADNISRVRTRRGAPQPGILTPEAAAGASAAPFTPLPAERVAASALIDHLLATVGARLPDERLLDALDRRLLREVRERRGNVIDDPADVGGWPHLPSASTDALRDLPHGPDAWRNVPGTKLSRIELYLAELAGDLDR